MVNRTCQVELIYPNEDFRIETAVMAAAMAAERGRKRRKRNINRTRRRRRLSLYQSSW